MNTNTLRFGMARTAVLTAVIAAAALYANNAHADRFVPQAPSAEQATALRAEATAAIRAELAAELAQAAAEHKAELLAAQRAARADLISKVAASALVAPRGFVLAIPAALVQPTL
jgi:hypothetical protein